MRTAVFVTKALVPQPCTSHTIDNNRVVLVVGPDIDKFSWADVVLVNQQKTIDTLVIQFSRQYRPNQDDVIIKKVILNLPPEITTIKMILESGIVLYQRIKEIISVGSPFINRNVLCDNVDNNRFVHWKMSDEYNSFYNITIQDDNTEYVLEYLKTIQSYKKKSNNNNHSIDNNSNNNNIIRKDLVFNVYNGNSSNILPIVDMLRNHIQSMKIFKSEEIKEVKEKQKEYKESEKDQEESGLVEHFSWRKSKLPKAGIIPNGIKKITFFNCQDPIPVGVIPDSVVYIKFKRLSICLSQISFPPNLKFLSIDKFNQFLIGQVLPPTLSHLRVTLYDNTYAHNYLSFKGTLPRNLSHLKIKKEFSHIYFDPPLLVPSNIKNLEIQENGNSDIQFVDPDEYHCNPITKDSLECLHSLKSITLNGDFATPNFFPNDLQSLDISVLPTFDINLIPTTLTSLICGSQDQIPSHVKLNYLKYRITGKKTMVFKVNDRSITRDNIPLHLDRNTNQFVPKPTIPIDELEWNEDSEDSKDEFKNIIPDSIIRKVKSNLPVYIPSSVEIYESNCLPINYPNSLETIILTGIGTKDIHFDAIPPTVKNLLFETDNEFLNKYSNENGLLKDKNSLYQIDYNYKNSIKESINSNNNFIGNDLYFYIWRNKYLHTKINQLLQPKLIEFTIEREGTSQNPRYHFKNQDNQQVHNLKFKSEDIASIPNGVSYYSVRNRAYGAKLLESLPSSVTKLRLSASNIDSITLPNIKHFIVDKSLNFKEFLMPSLETLEIKRPLDLRDLLKKSTVKRVILKPGFFENGQKSKGFYREILKYLNENNLLTDGRYEIYKAGGPIPPSTIVLVWNKNQMIPHNIIPHGVKRIIFGRTFNQAILFDTIPSSVTEINFGQKFNQLSNIFLPQSVKYISLYFKSCSPLVHTNYKQVTWPPNLIHLKIKDYEGSLYFNPIAFLPKSIKYLWINQHRFKQDMDNKTSFFKIKSIYSNGNINNTAEKMISSINNYIDDKLKDAPMVDVFTSTSSRDSSKPISFPNIKSITFKNNFNQAIPEGLISSSCPAISKLIFPKASKFNQQLFVVPPTVQHLELGSEFNQELKSFMIPASLTKLYLSKSFNQPIPIGILPNGLKVLDLGSSFDQFISIGTIPDTVEE
ncbi:hypothetical protein CYY_010136, partial [Polysphondylium violaceum]